MGFGENLYGQLCAAHPPGVCFSEITRPYNLGTCFSDSEVKIEKNTTHNMENVLEFVVLELVLSCPENCP